MKNFCIINNDSYAVFTGKIAKNVLAHGICEESSVVLFCLSGLMLVPNSIDVLSKNDVLTKLRVPKSLYKQSP